MCTDNLPNHEILLRLENLSVDFRRGLSRVPIVNGVSLDLSRGKTLGVVGESGCGKSVTSLAVMGLLPNRTCSVGGRILFDGRDLTRLSSREMNSIRGDRIAMVFQEPMSSLNPVFTIGDQIGEALRLHQGICGAENRRKCIELLSLVRIGDPEKTIRKYPHTLSGGMRQRVMIAMALCCNPEIIIADEPTTALDVTIQADILDLFKSVQKEHGTSILFISHDLGVIAEIADNVAVMYAGHIVEEYSASGIFDRPLHPYTKGLLDARTGYGLRNNGRLRSIPGSVPVPGSIGSGCPFAPRCALAGEECLTTLPPLREVSLGHKVRCGKAAFNV